MTVMTDDTQAAFEAERELIGGKIGIGREFLYLTRDECARAGPDRKDIMSIVKETLVAHGQGAYEMPAKIGIHPHEDVFYHAMPAYVPGMLACGCKWIECYPQNPKKYGLPQTTSLLILNDVMCGAPISVMDGTWITAMRTPAVTAIAAAVLHQNAETFGMFGCGVQGAEHVRFISMALKRLKKIYVYDIDVTVMKNMIASVQPDVPVEIIAGEGFEHVAKSCEVLSSATLIVKEPIAAVADEWVGSGQTILPCDLNTFWDPKTQRRADKYIVDSADEHRLFAEMGYFPDGLPAIHAQTGEVVARLAKGREHKDELIVCSNIGMSVFDVAVAHAVFTRALDMGIGAKLPL